MFSKLLLSEKDLESIQQALFGNPLLASLLMTSPADAFRYLNLMPRFLDALLPPPAEDARLVQDLKRALDEGRTALEHPYAVRQPDAAMRAAPAQPQAEVGTAEPDVALSISKAALQRVVVGDLRPYPTCRDERQTPAERCGGSRRRPHG